MYRISFDKIWMDLAISISLRSTDEKHKVGCVIVDENNTSVLAIGYNGDHKGGTNQRLSLEHGKSGFIHAETNALIKLDYHNHCNKVMFVTLSPCYSCSQQIINAGIKKVVYLKKYNDDGINLLKSFSIEVEHYQDI